MIGRDTHAVLRMQLYAASTTACTLPKRTAEAYSSGSLSGASDSAASFFRIASDTCTPGEAQTGIQSAPLIGESSKILFPIIIAHCVTVVVCVCACVCVCVCVCVLQWLRSHVATAYVGNMHPASINATHA